MYNKEIKMRYIDEFYQQGTAYADNYLENLFSKVGKIEEMYGKDLCNFSYYEVVGLMKMMQSSSIRGVVQRKTIFSNYVKWCLAQGLVEDGQNHFEEITRNSYADFVNELRSKNYFVSIDRMNKWLNACMNASDELMLLGAFEGLDSVEMNDLASLRIEDVDIENRIVHTASGRNVKVSQRLIEIIIEANAETSIAHSTENEVIKKRKLTCDGTVLKRSGRGGMDTEERKRYWLARRYARLMVVLGETNFPRKKIAYSGLVWYINTRAEELGISAKEFCQNYGKEIEEKFGSLDYQTTFFFEQYNEYLI